LGAPLDVEDAVGRIATGRGKDSIAAVCCVEVVPIQEDSVVVRSPWQTDVKKVGSCSGELSIAVGRHNHRGKGLVIQCVREWQRNRGGAVVGMIPGIGRAWHDTAAYLSDRVMV
jgi:hypothetical protein